MIIFFFPLPTQPMWETILHKHTEVLTPKQSSHWLKTGRESWLLTCNQRCGSDLSCASYAQSHTSSGPLNPDTPISTESAPHRIRIFRYHSIAVGCSSIVDSVETRAEWSSGVLGRSLPATTPQMPMLWHPVFFLLPLVMSCHLTKSWSKVSQPCVRSLLHFGYAFAICGAKFCLYLIQMGQTTVWRESCFSEENERRKNNNYLWCSKT
jgi:hypothetical protein